MKAKRIPFGAAGALLVLLSLLLFAAACGDDDDDADPTATESAVTEPTDAEPAASETTIDVSLTEFTIEPSEDSAPAGTITFNVTSDGAIFHNLKVVATDLAADALPVDDATFSVDEAEVVVVASTDDLNSGDQVTLSVELAAGTYVLICNVPTHYDAGMTVAFTIE